MSLDLESWHAFLKCTCRYSFDWFIFFFSMQNANKVMYCLPVFPQVKPRLLVLPTTICLSFSSSCHPATSRCHCLWHSSETLSTWPLHREHPSLPLLPPNPSEDCCKETGDWGGLRAFTWQFLCLYKRRVQTYKNVTDYNCSPQMPLAL